MGAVTLINQTPTFSITYSSKQTEFMFTLTVSECAAIGCFSLAMKITNISREVIIRGAQIYLPL
jgi:hypothetical protein